MPIYEYQCSKCGRAFEELVFSASEAEGDSLAKALFGIKGVTSVFCTHNFVTLTLGEGVTLEAIGSQVSAAVETQQAAPGQASAPAESDGEGEK